MTASDPAGPGHSRQTDPASRPDADPPHWQVRADRPGNLVATLTGTYPPLTVTAPDEESLNKKIKTLIMRAML
jgi:hypothetical protein